MSQNEGNDTKGSFVSFFPTVDDDDAGADQGESDDGEDRADHARLAKEQGGEHGAKTGFLKAKKTATRGPLAARAMDHIEYAAAEIKPM